ncbi:alpha/beta hydrolase family protein [Pseudoxanthomonas composti]|uniref:Alpha/beta fold hydrolase n=1 Tax=Pseudoxanthomonas composti TaxID=2137479 RepID=A0A4Q1JQU4_9GAMM|nr:alpha/beta fold hydrolase [Pseudoxanthomonas composti]RXQ99133.1 alpha/beta fold hydrolase [Pseudoxanthomonas composti]
MEVSLESVKIGIDEEELAGTLLAPARELPGVLFVHGWGGSQDHDLTRAREAAGLGCVCLTFDLRGHDGNALTLQTVTREHNLEDLLRCYDWFVQQPNVDANAITVVGISYGAYLAAILSSLRPVRWLALRTPAIYKDENWNLPKRALHEDPDLVPFRHRQVSWQENRALAACAQFRGDALIVEAEHDRIIPHQVIENYMAAFNRARSRTSRVIADADHGFSEKATQKAYTTVLIKWLTEMVVGAREHAARAKVAERKRESRAGDTTAQARATS